VEQTVGVARLVPLAVYAKSDTLPRLIVVELPISLLRICDFKYFNRLLDHGCCVRASVRPLPSYVLLLRGLHLDFSNAFNGRPLSLSSRVGAWTRNRPSGGRYCTRIYRWSPYSLGSSSPKRIEFKRRNVCFVAIPTVIGVWSATYLSQPEICGCWNCAESNRGRSRQVTRHEFADLHRAGN
jgi:hypothetical protein